MVWHVDNETAPLVKPQKKSVFSSQTRFFTDAIGQQPTVPQADWFNMVQGELLGMADALGVTPDKLDDKQLGIALKLALQGEDIEEKLGVFWGYRPDYHYRPFDKVIFWNGLNREVYQVYHPNGVIGKDPRDAKNRPSGWTNSDPSQPYYWIKLSETGERGQIGSYVIAQSFERQENWLPAVGGLFEVNAGLLPWLYRANFGRLPNTNEMLKYGIRENDFMRFITQNVERALLSSEEDAIRNMTGKMTNIASQLFRDQTIKNYYAEGVFGSNAKYGQDFFSAPSSAGGIGTHRIYTFNASNVVPTAEENRPVNTALTAFLII